MISYMMFESKFDIFNEIHFGYFAAYLCAYGHQPDFFFEVRGKNFGLWKGTWWKNTPAMQRKLMFLIESLNVSIKAAWRP